MSSADLYTFEDWLGFESVVSPSIDEGELRAQALRILAIRTPDDKCTTMRAAYNAGTQGRLSLDAARDWRDDTCLQRDCPGIPDKPELIHATETLRRSMNTREGRAIAVHALAHIEFNAINLALDAMVRFVDLPEDYYWDWWRVAAEEAYHFSLIRAHLRALGADYGDYPAHTGLWDMAQRTENSLADRMAMVPRTLEARGLDACPLMQQKFRQAGDEQAARILDIILRDEITHVALGHRWFIWACERQHQEPIAAYRRIAEQHHAPRLRPPFNIPARRAAGFFEEELTSWQNEQ